MFDDFLLRALVGGLGVALVAGPFGSFVVWRRLAYFGDTLAHSALLGVALGFVLHVNLTVGIVVICQLLAILLFASQRQRQLASDTLLGIFAHGALSLGLVTLAFMDDVRIDLVGYLFGDILAIGSADLGWIFIGGGMALGGLLWLWKPLLAITIHEDLARVEGIAVDRINWLFLGLIALTVAVMMKVVGMLLVTSLLIIPAATARRFAVNPEIMALLSSLIGCGAVALGLYGSFQFDTPSGPSIVVGACLIFILAFLVPGPGSKKALSRN
ncbi:MAG: metal ABC transporter permease [Desulfuromonadales bacterium]|nr:metal ABC transporter permease [Desulfuromonadales bacterium]MBN2792554.1 metal ABC transporter permease [Desulfuromonadales bacterium]